MSSAEIDQSTKQDIVLPAAADDIPAVNLRAPGYDSEPFPPLPEKKSVGLPDQRLKINNELLPAVKAEARLSLLETLQFVGDRPLSVMDIYDEHVRNAQLAMYDQTRRSFREVNEADAHVVANGDEVVLEEKGHLDS